MTPEWLAIAAGLAAVASVVLSYIVAIRSSRAETRRERDSEVEGHIVTNRKLDAISEDLGHLGRKVDKLSLDVADLKVTVAVHDDRFRRPLRAINGE